MLGYANIWAVLLLYMGFINGKLHIGALIVICPQDTWFYHWEPINYIKNEENAATCGRLAVKKLFYNREKCNRYDGCDN